MKCLKHRFWNPHVQTPKLDIFGALCHVMSHHVLKLVCASPAKNRFILPNSCNSSIPFRISGKDFDFLGQDERVEGLCHGKDPEEEDLDATLLQVEHDDPQSTTLKSRPGEDSDHI